MKRPMFSVIIPTLNEEKFLPNLLDSLSKQSFKDFEVIVVDGNSSDKTILRANGFLSTLPKFQIINSQKASLPLQRNIGARHAKGEWLLFNDADNILLPYCLERCYSTIQKNINKQHTFYTSWFAPDSETSGDAILDILSIMFIESAKRVHRQIAPGPFALIKHDVFTKIGGYDETRGYGEDQEISMRLYEHGYQLNFIRETLYVYSLRRFRKHGTLKILHTYLIGGIITLLTKRAPKNFAGYIMGGHLYEKPKVPKQSVITQSEEKLKQLIKELFS
jgi:glycosyltransferase involved in cell wall biosynthesis